MSHYPPPAGYPQSGTPPQGYPPVQQQQQQGWAHPAPPAAPAGYAAPQQMAPQPQHGSVQPRVVVVEPRFCLPQQVTLVMQEAFGGRSRDDFHIADGAGVTYFVLKAAAMSVSGRRMLFDAHGQPCIAMEQKALTLHGTWIMRRPTDGVQLAEVKPSMSALSPTIKVFLNDGDKEPDFFIKGDIRAKAFSFVQARSGAVIASVKKESKYSNMNAFMMSKLTNAQKYFLTIEPGVDAAFVTALATLVDEIFHDAR